MTCGFESIKVGTPKHPVQIEVSEERSQLLKVFFHAAKLRGPTFCMPCTNSLFNGTFSSTNQMVKIGGRRGGEGETIYFSWKRGDQMFQRGANFLIYFHP